MIAKQVLVMKISGLRLSKHNVICARFCLSLNLSDRYICKYISGCRMSRSEAGTSESASHGIGSEVYTAFYSNVPDGISGSRKKRSDNGTFF
jgi:hypothetical protein